MMWCNAQKNRFERAHEGERPAPTKIYTLLYYDSLNIISLAAERGSYSSRMERKLRGWREVLS